MFLLWNLGFGVRANGEGCCMKLSKTFREPFLCPFSPKRLSSDGVVYDFIDPGGVRADFAPRFVRADGLV